MVQAARDHNGRVGGFISGNAGNLTLSLNENNIAAANLTLQNGRFRWSRVCACYEASDIQIFTREGRHVAGTAQTGEGRMLFRSYESGKRLYRWRCLQVRLSASGDDGYLGMSVDASYDSDVLFNVEEGDELTTVRFSVLEGIDTTRHLSMACLPLLGLLITG